MEKGAATLKRVFLELGGKSAMIVLRRRRLRRRSVPMASMVCVHAGQGCAMQTRLLLPRSRYDEGVELITAGMAGVPYGDPSSDAVVMGPSSAPSSATVCSATSPRARRRAPSSSSAAAARPTYPKGWFVEPTLFVDVDNSMTIAQEEIFGPVLCVIPYEDDDDAVRIANESNYGLSGGVVSASEERATAIARRIRTGSIGVNGGLWYGADSPYGGYKDSGIGRQCGIEGLEQYLETKAIAWPG